MYKINVNIYVCIYIYVQPGIRLHTYMYNHIDLNISHPLPVSMVHMSIQSHLTITHSTFINQIKSKKKKKIV